MTAPAGNPRTSVYQLLEDNRATLRLSIEGMSDEQMVAPIIDDWSAKDLLTHITAWEELTLLDLQRVKRGHVPALACFQQDRVDAWNDMMMSVRRDFTLEQVQAELTGVRDGVMQALDSLSDDAFTGGFVPGTCQVNAFHDWDHANQIREWRKEAGI